MSHSRCHSRPSLVVSHSRGPKSSTFGCISAGQVTHEVTHATHVAESLTLPTLFREGAWDPAPSSVSYVEQLAGGGHPKKLQTGAKPPGLAHAPASYELSGVSS